jgi:hypothetical protein
MHPHANFPLKLIPSHHLSSTTVITATLFQIPSFKLNPVPVVGSQKPNHMKKNHVKTRSVASAIYGWSHAIVSRQAVTFPMNLKSIRHHRW